MTRKYVLTAGPCAGKSSTLRELSARGYTVMPEAARIVTDQAISEGKDVAEMKQDPSFHAMVEEEDERILNNVPEDEDLVFMDRSIADNVAYRRANDRPVPDHVIDLATDEFAAVFFLERLNEFEEDEARAGDDEEWASFIHDELRDVYEELGYTVVDVPLMPIDQRADLIEEWAVNGPPVKGH